MSRIIIALYIITTSLALIVLRLGAKDGAPASFVDGRLQFNINALTVIGVLLFGMSFALYTYLLSIYDLGYIVPVTTAFVYVIIFTASYFIFSESFTVMKVIAIMLILSGVILINLNNG